ncbi:MAG: hypothetical protein Q8O14_07810 [bacterium]|jgi:hypothetical protein|nr:hypothetical protein [bacterium]
MDGLVLGAGSGIARAVLRQAWREEDGKARWVLASRSGEALPDLAAAAGGRRLQWARAEARENPAPWLARVGADGWRPQLILVAWGILVPEGRGTAAELAHMREVNGAATLRWLEELAGWLGEARSAEAPRIAVLGSVAGDRPRRRQWEYSLSKQELERGIDRLRRRTPWVRYVLVKPGPVATPMTAHLPPGPLLSRPEAIAPRIWSAWRAGRPAVYAPAWWGAISRLLSLVPEPLWKHVPF